MGGMDVSRIDPETLLSLYSIVFQDVTLFDNTILENIRIGNKDATDEQVIAAAKLANVDEFAEKLPDGWHTNIGENGCELSGGERQRISIARAFLKNAPIILLDEATASLDVENETLIQTALSRLIADKTVLVIAHRMRTVAGAEKIIADIRKMQQQIGQGNVKEHQLIDAKTQLANLHQEETLKKNKVLKKAKEQKTLKPGDEVLVTTYGQRGTLLRKNGNQWQVEIGILKMNVSEDELTPVSFYEYQQ